MMRFGLAATTLPVMSDLERAVEILRRGGLVAFPTETVYGLGGDATNAAAVRRIFAAKGRPATNPLIIHVADERTARRYAGDWPGAAEQLANAFWPGPLTLVLPKTPAIVAEATAHLPTVAIRCPSHPVALELLREFGGPVAAPSANRSSRVSPTAAQHVRDELGEAVDLVLDGGHCEVGIESTVLDLTSPRPTILRPGSVTRDQIETLIGAVELSPGRADAEQAAASPGQQAVHYSPATPTFRFDRQDRPLILRLLAKSPPGNTGALLLDDDELLDRVPVDDALRTRPNAGFMPTDPDDYARVLYRMLRQLDAAGLRSIWVEMPPDWPQWAAVRDRLSRAARLPEPGLSPD
jgi:L-threonylcarbamoyladenylate synthase